MLLKFMFLISFNIVLCIKLDVLTNNFFDNLQGDPSLIVENALNDNSKQFIEKQIENYVNLITHEKSKATKKKRSLLDKITKEFKGSYVLSGLLPLVTVPAVFPEDIKLFYQNSHLYAAALESKNVRKSADNLVVYQYQNDSFSEISRISVTKATKLSVINLGNLILIAIAENDTVKDQFHEKSGIYQFSIAGLDRIQSVNMEYASDIVMWNIHNEIYLSIAQFMSNKTGNIHYDVEIPIYKWMGKHFDQVQKIKGKGVWKITPYSVDHLSFLAVANLRDDLGNTKMYSEIYKYDYHLENYILHQRILTRACTDIQFFSFLENTKEKHHFLVVANSHEKGPDGDTNFLVDSIIYKLVDDYFIPFQTLELTAVEKWLPVEGPNNEIILFAVCQFDGIKVYQFDGWSFREITQRSVFFRQTGVKTISLSNFNDSQVLVVANKNNKGNDVNVFKLNYTYHNTLNEIYDDMITWCNRGLEKIEDLSGKGIFDVLLKEAKRADIDETSTESDELEEIDEKIEALSNDLDSLNLLLQQNYTTDKESVNVSDLSADTVIFNKRLFVQNVQTDKINNLKTKEFLENILDINIGFELDEMNLTSATIEGSLIANKINNEDPQTLLHLSDDINLENLNIKGSVDALNSTNLNGKLNGIIISNQNVLLKVGNQTFLKPLNLSTIKVDEITVGSLNGRELTEKLPNPPDINIKHLTIKDLTIGGYINEIDMPTLEKYALRTTGNQEILSKYIFDELEGRNLEAKINSKKLSDLIPTDEGNYTINQVTIFSNDLTVNNLEILENLNDIKVENGKLDVLLKDAEQEISGEKIFNDLAIYKAIYLQGNIKSQELEKMNPMVTVEEEVTLEGDFTITGDVLIENLGSVDDIITSDGFYSLSKLETDGIKLTDDEILPSLRFVQQLNVDEIFVNTINDKDPTTYVVTGSEETQSIQAPKIFTGDLYITGATNAFQINNVNVEELENNVLEIDGDQVIEGKHHVKNLIVNNIWTNSPKFRNFDIESIKPKSETMDGDFQQEIVKTKRIFVKGLVNGLNFDDIINDTVTENTDAQIRGTKTIDSLNVNSLHVEQGIVDKILQETTNLKLNGPINITQINVENLHFEQELNNIARDSFGQHEFDQFGNQIVHGDHIFDTIRIYKRAFINSSKINHVSMDDLINKTVKIDEPHQFNTATFEDTIISKTVLLDGAIENFDFDNVVFSDFDSEQTIFDKKIFKNVTVNGTVSLNGDLNDINFDSFCKFTMGESDCKSLTIKGDVIFVKGPHLGHINDINVTFIQNNAWFSDKPTILNGNIEFDNVLFENDIQVKGFVDNVSLKILSENYFSKSKPQEIAAIFNFENSLIFENDVSAPDMTVRGEINGINLDSLIRTILLNNTEQMFESLLYLEKCRVKDLTGQFTVNNLNIDQDVMRYDKANMVTGTKFFDNLDVEFLKLEKNIKIQEVDVLDWIKKSVLKSTSVNITGTKNFRNLNCTKGLQLNGKLNGRKFDENNVIVKNIPQNITGKKTIFTKKFDPVTFKSIKLKGLLNNIDVADLIKNQAYKNQENIFKTNLNLRNNITTNNLMIRKSYQGVNVTELITNVTNLGALNNLLQQFNKLRNMSLKLEKSIKEQAYFVHHYKIIQTIPHIANSMKIVMQDGTTKIGTLTKDNSGLTRIELYGWHRQKQQFIRDSNIHLGNKDLSFVDQVLMGRFLYLELSDGTANFVEMTNMNRLISIPTNHTKTTISFIIPSTNQACTLFVYFESSPKIYCENEDEINFLQSINSPNAYEASSVTIGLDLYLIIINEPANGIDSRTDLWLLNNRTNTFQIHQSLFEAQPKSIATVHYHGFYYLAIASGHLQNAIYSGRVELKRFDQLTQKFEPFQSLELDAPVLVQFSIFPSDELVLYVLTDNPTEPLLVYRYEGVAGFKTRVVGSTLPRISYMNHFMGAVDQHLIVAQSANEINVIQAIFKGEKVTDGMM